MEYEVIIKEQHIDTLGHMNNAVYLELYEEARWEYITARGYGLKEIQEYRKGPVVLDAHIQFLKEIRLREKIKITFEPDEAQRKIIKIHQKMIKENGDIASTLTITVGFFDLDKRKLVDPTSEWQKVLAKA